MKNFKIGALMFSDVFPVPKNKLLKYYKNAKIKINVEQNYTNQFGKLIQLETEITYDYSINKYDGRQMTSEFILKNMEDILNE
jgi:2-oxoglutarate ferredoxin oxidoreductase subunit alpha